MSTAIAAVVALEVASECTGWLTVSDAYSYCQQFKAQSSQFNARTFSTLNFELETLNCKIFFDPCPGKALQPTFHLRLSAAFVCCTKQGLAAWVPLFVAKTPNAANLS